jgi:hypothetical protein
MNLVKLRCSTLISSGTDGGERINIQIMSTGHEGHYFKKRKEATVDCG